jgi:hypothetical protein
VFCLSCANRKYQERLSPRSDWLHVVSHGAGATQNKPEKRRADET